MPLSDAKRLERRERLLAAARELLRRVGYDNVTMTALADAGGVTAPTLYNIFGSKDELLFEAVFAAYEGMLQRAGLAVGVRGLDRVIAILTATATAIDREPEYARALLEVFYTRIKARVLSRADRTAAQKAIEEAVAEMAADGELEPWVDTALLGARVGALQRILNAEWLGGTIPLEELADVTVFAVCLMLAGAATPETAERARRIARERQERLTAASLAVAGSY